MPKVQACPTCGSTRIYPRSSAEPRWRCKECGAECDEPLRRQSSAANPAAGNAPAVRALIDADPEDWP